MLLLLSYSQHFVDCDNNGRVRKKSCKRKTPVILAVNKNSINFQFDVYWVQLPNTFATFKTRQRNEKPPLDELKSAIHISHRTEFMDIMKPQFRYYWFDLFSRKYLIGSPTLFEALRLMCYVLVSIRDLMANLCWRTHEMPFLGKWN